MKPLLIFLLTTLIPSAYSMASEGALPVEAKVVAQKALVILVLLTATVTVVIAIWENAAVRTAALNELETTTALTSPTAAPEPPAPDLDL